MASVAQPPILFLSFSFFSFCIYKRTKLEAGRLAKCNNEDFLLFQVSTLSGRCFVIQRVRYVFRQSRLFGKRKKKLTIRV